MPAQITNSGDKGRIARVLEFFSAMATADEKRILENRRASREERGQQVRICENLNQLVAARFAHEHTVRGLACAKSLDHEAVVVDRDTGHKRYKYQDLPAGTIETLRLDLRKKSGGSLSFEPDACEFRDFRSRLEAGANKFEVEHILRPKQTTTQMAKTKRKRQRRSS